jgi:hypothetical protein
LHSHPNVWHQTFAGDAQALVQLLSFFSSLLPGVRGGKMDQQAFLSLQHKFENKLS